MKKLLLSIAAITAAAVTAGAQGYGDQGVVTAPAKYVADLWLAHKDARGVDAPSQHVTLPLAESAAGDFIFQPIRFELPSLDADQGDMQAYLQVLGTVRASSAPDGRIALAVSPSRSQGLRRASDAASRQILPTPAGRGAKDFVVADNEAVAMELPAPSSGYYMRSLKDDRVGVVTPGGGAGGVMTAAPTPSAPVARGGGAGSGVVTGGSASAGGGGTMTRVAPTPTPTGGGAIAGGFGGGAAVAPRGATPSPMSTMPNEPVFVKDGRMVLRTDLFFKGHTTTLTVRVRRQ